MKPPVRHGLARVLSKRGVCSRSQAAKWVEAGRVRVDGRVVRDPEYPVVDGRHAIDVDGERLPAVERRYIALNKPRGLVTSTTDERGRDTVYRCLDGTGLPWVAPVGRLDKASEGLLLLCNDPEWAARITDPSTGPDKTYHVQVDVVPSAATLDVLVQGAVADGEHLAAREARLLRAGSRNAWLEIVLTFRRCSSRSACDCQHGSSNARACAGLWRRAPFAAPSLLFRHIDSTPLNWGE